MAPSTLQLVLIINVLCLLQVASFAPVAFFPHQLSRHDFSVREGATPDLVPPPQNEEEELSDLDARVLQSMLRDGALDLVSEEDMRKLLERGVGPKNAPTFDFDDDESEYASKVVSTLTDTKLWRKLRAQYDDILETASIYVNNRIERDAKLLASIGIFAWERAVRDVARALPATSGAAKVVRTAAFQLGSATSVDRKSVKEAFEKASAQERAERNLEDINLYDELNTPLDEIRSVTQAISDILKGEPTTTSRGTASRGLRSAAPAGTKTRTERQQRAYQKRKQTVLKREKEGINVARVAGGIADVAWEVKQDLQVESNKPGYKTERVRRVIAAGAETTSRVIAAAREGEPGAWRKMLFGSKEEEQVLELESAQDFFMESIPEIPDIPDLPDLPEIPPEPVLELPNVLLPAELVDEQASVVARLKLCIEKPELTWLTPEVLASSETPINADGLQNVVTAMICARDDLDGAKEEPGTIRELVNRLKRVKNDVDMVHSMALASAGETIASQLRNYLYGSDPDDEIQPTLLSLNEIQATYERDVTEAEKIAEAAQAAYEVALEERETTILEWERIFELREALVQEAKRAAEEAAAMDAAIEAENARLETERAAKETIIDVGGFADAVIVDATPLSFERTKYATSSGDVEVILDDNFPSFFAEVVNDGQEQNNRFKRVSTELNEDEEEEPNMLAVAALRSLDLVFAMLEKTVMVLPGVFQLYEVASRRVDDASREGMGRIGWKRIENTERGSKRY